MSEKQSDNEKWESCPAGELGGLVSNLRRRRQLRSTKMAAGIAAAALFVVLIGNFAVTSLNAPGSAIAAINCFQVEDLVPQYVEGSLNSEQTAQLEQHLTTCDHCTEVIARLRREKAGNNDAAHAIPADRQARAPIVVAVR